MRRMYTLDECARRASFAVCLCALDCHARHSIVSFVFYSDHFRTYLFSKSFIFGTSVLYILCVCVFWLSIRTVRDGVLYSTRRYFFNHRLSRSSARFSIKTRLPFGCSFIVCVCVSFRYHSVVSSRSANQFNFQSLFIITFHWTIVIGPVAFVAKCASQSHRSALHSLYMYEYTRSTWTL